MRIAALLALWLTAKLVDRWVNANRTDQRLLVGAVLHIILFLATAYILLNSIIVAWRML